eukprot:g13489.t1
MLHEVILALLGHPGAIIQEQAPTVVASRDTGARGKNGAVAATAAVATFRVPDSITFLTSTEREAINRVVGMGSVYRDLRRFVQPVLGHGHGHGAQREGEEGGLYLRALKAGVCEVVDEYAACVAGVEADVMADPTLTLARVYAGVREYQSILPAVAEACAAVTSSNTHTHTSGGLKGPQLLEALHERSHFGGPDVRRRLCRLVWHCRQVLINQCSSWLLHGLLVDPFEEFFVQKNLDPVSASSGGTASGSSLTNSLSFAAGLDDAGNDTWIDDERWTGLDDGVGGEGEGEGVWERSAAGADAGADAAGSVDWRAEEEWNSTYTLRLALVPSAFVPHGLAQKILFVGKVVRVLRQTKVTKADVLSGGMGNGNRDGNGGGDDGDSMGAMGVSEAEVLELTQRWLDLRDREAFHLLALERAVHEAHSLVDRRLYRLLNVSGLDRHLSSLKGLFLMGHGSLFHAFFDKARDAMKVKAGDRAVLDLNTWLAAAAEDCNADHEDDAEGHDRDHDRNVARSSFANGLDRARLDLDPPGFSCKTFQDLTGQGFCVTGAATYSSKKSSVCLCPGGPGPDPHDPRAPPSRRSTTSASSSSKSPSRTPRPQGTPAPASASTSTSTSTRPGSECGSLWYTSDREVPRGFRSSVAFRFDRPKHSRIASLGVSPDPATVSGQEQGVGRRAGATGSLRFVIHQYRAALSGSGGDESRREGGASAGLIGFVPNSLSVWLEPDGEGGGQVSIRWNPHRLPSLRRPDVGASGSGTTAQSGADPRRSRQQEQVEAGHDHVRMLGQASLPRSCGLSLDQVNYLMVDYVVGQPRPGRDGGEDGRADTKEGARLGTGAELMVFVNDPGRSGSAVLSLKLDMWRLIELGGGRAFVGVSAQGPWRATLRQWDFHLGGASALGKMALGPLGGVGSGPRVEEMLEAMDSWSGLCLQYRLEWPLHLVLTRETMQTYNRLFRLLASVKRASLELERVWPTLMQSRYRGMGDKEKTLLGPLWMLRARMAFFVANLAFYLQVDVVEAAYSSLQNKLGTVRDFVSLQRAHQEFLATLRAKFYIDNLEISQGLGRALRHVLRFCCLFVVHGDATDILAQEVTALHNAFQVEMKLLVPVLEKLAKELMVRLDYNGHFSAAALHY